MMQIFGSCGRYVQGYGAIQKLKSHVAYMGNTFLVIGSARRIRALRSRIETSFGGTDHLIYGDFGGESSRKEVEKHLETVRSCRVDAVIGIGGGKVMDTAKAVATLAKLPVAIVPTIAASDAATSATALLYNDEGTDVVECIQMAQSPALVLVDTQIILEAPTRFLVAGMGDALSTYLGARVAAAGYKENYYGGLWTKTSLEIAKLSYELLMQYGRQAKVASEQKALTDAFNTIVEVNTLMSGLGFENNGSATDHAFWFGMLAVPRYTAHALHGEGVAFSCCCQLVLEGADSATIDQVYRFCVDVGLPVTMEQLGLPDATREELTMMAESMLRRPINHPFAVTAEMLTGAYQAADALGRLYLEGNRII